MSYTKLRRSSEFCICWYKLFCYFINSFISVPHDRGPATKIWVIKILNQRSNKYEIGVFDKILMYGKLT